MTLEEMERLFDESDDYGEFKKIENPMHSRPDLCAFLMLEKLVPHHGRDKQDMICGAEHDKFFIVTDPEALAAVATPEIVRDLRRCGVIYSETDGFFMFA